MKKIVTSLVVAGAMIAASNVGASMIDDICPLVGIDYQQVWSKGKGDFGQLLPKSYPGASVYIGTRWAENWGVEVGFDYAARKHKSFTLPAGSTFFGSSVGGAPINGRVAVRRTGGHIDLAGYWCVADCLELVGTVGIGLVHPKISVTAITTTGNAAIVNSLQAVSTKTKAVPRVRVGANYMLTDCVGVRGLVGWEGTSSLRLKNNNTAGVNLANKAFKSSATLSAGVFVKF
jgi:hypothetical protein